MSAHQSNLGPFWRQRYWAARKMISWAMWIMPRCRYRNELNAALWTLGLKVQAHSAALSAAEEVNDVQS